MRGDKSTLGAGWWSSATAWPAPARSRRSSPAAAREQFAITMFGDEPYGNYNRIMLSHVLSGEETDADIFLNTLRLVRRERHHPARRGAGRRGSTGSPSWSSPTTAGSTPYDELIIATGSRSFIPPMDGLRTDDGDAAAGRLRRSAPSTTPAAMIDYAQHERPPPGGRHRRRAARPGGRPRAAGATGCRSTWCTPAPHLMNAQLGPAGGGDPAQERGGPRHRRCTPSARTTAILGDGQGRAASGCSDGPLLDVRHGRRRRRHPAQRRPRRRPAGSPSSAAIVVDDQMRTVDDPDVYAVGECAQHRGEVYGLVAPLWEQAVVLADQLTGADPDAAYHGSRTATKLKVAGVDVAVDGRQGPERDDDELVVFSEPKQRRLQVLVIRDDKLIGATLLGDSSQGRVPDPGVRPRAAAARGAASSCCSTSARRRRRSASPSWPTTRRSATATASPRAPSCACVRRRRASPSPAVMDADPGRQGLRVLQDAGRADRRVGGRRRRRRGPVGELVRAGHPDGQAGADGGDPRAGPAVGVRGVRRARPGRRRGREVEDGPGLAAEDDVGRRVRRRDATPGSSTTGCTPTSSRTARSRSSRR